MRNKKRLIGAALILAAVLMFAFEQIDIIGRLNEWRHVPDAAVVESTVADDGTSSGKQAAGATAHAARPPENPYAADIARWQTANSDVIAWLDVPDLLSTPVVQGADNDYYLNHDATGGVNRNGAAFIDYELPEQAVDNVVIYGHNMANSQVFSDLDAFRDESYAKAHRQFRYATEKAVWTAEVLCVCNMNLADPAQFFSFNSWLTWQDGRNAGTYLEGLKPSMLFRLDTPVAPEDRLLTLSTCDNAQKDARILIVARLLPEGTRPQ